MGLDKKAETHQRLEQASGVTTSQEERNHLEKALVFLLALKEEGHAQGPGRKDSGQLDG